jgi:hypothetical protein
MTTLALVRPQVGWSFWLQWVIVMTVFASLSYIAIDTVVRPIAERSVRDPWAQEATIVVALAVLGAAFGITQSLLLRRHLHRASTWGLASAVTFWVGATLTEIAFFSGVTLLPSFALNFLLLGPVCGMLQWLTVRHQIARAGWWVVVQTLGWPMLYAVSAVAAYGATAAFGGRVDDYLPISYGVGGAALGALTGTVMIWLLCQPTQQPHTLDVRR